MSRLFSIGALPLVLLISLSLTGCTAEAKKARAVKRADSYLAAGDYEKAKIEYLNALRAGPPDAEVLQKLGEIWLKQGVLLEAYRHFSAGQKLKPDDLPLRVQATEALLALGQYAQVRTEALAILQADPANPAGIRILADASRTPEELADLEQRLKAFPDRESSSFHIATATLALRRQDQPGAEAAIQQALAADPKSAQANALRTALHLIKGDREGAKAQIKEAGSAAPARSLERVNAASLMAQEGDLEGAKRVLEEITKEAPDYVPALRVQAQIAWNEKKHDEALKLIDKALATDPGNFEVRLLQAEIWLNQGETKKAVEAMERLAAQYPAPIAQYQLARAYVQDNNLTRATAVLTQAITANHDFTEAILLLGQLDLRSGNADAVVPAMENLLKKRPNLPQAQFLLVDAYRAVARFDDAAAIIRGQINASPNSWQPHLLLGMILRQQKNVKEARQSFEKALELAPDNLAGLNQLIELDLQEKDYLAAEERLRSQLSKMPESAALHFLKGKVHLAQRQWDQAEASLQKTLELEPNFVGGPDLLISVYVNTKKLPQALEQLSQVLEKQPSNTGALMLTALIHEQMKRFEDARAAYEKLLNVAPNSPVAQNNLAYLYSEHLDDLDKALQHAMKARAARPEDASIADTLGWIFHRRGDYQQAQTLLRESAAKLPENPEVQYHLGMATYMMGQVDAAKSALEKAVSSPGEFRWKEEARSRLALLGAANAPDLTLAELEEMARQQPTDPFGALRLGMAQEAEGFPEKAAETYQAVIRLNPKLSEPYLQLAKLYSGPLKREQKALEFAKKARDLAPDDPKSTATLGAVALATGDAAWAYDLLQESRRKLPTDPKFLKDFATAAYLVSKFAEAEDAMQKVVEEAPESAEAGEAKRFLDLVSMERQPQDLAGSNPVLTAALKEDPRNIPALMVQARIELQKARGAEATKIYNKVLQIAPDFALAQKHLAALYAEDPATYAQAYTLASKARRHLPDDPGLALTLGQLLYQRKEYKSALQILQSSAASASPDPKRQFYIGMASLGDGHHSMGKGALTKALEDGLKEPLAAEARAALKKLGE